MKIIAVDDDQISLDLLNECLAQGGYHNATFMSSPTEVLAKMTEAAVAFDCVLLDVDMPGKDGIQLCAEIRGHPRYKNTPIIMITKHSAHDAVELAFANGATDYVTKPFEFFEVLTRIKVAEMLVQERQAAIDSYVSVQQAAPEKRKLFSVPSTRKERLEQEGRHSKLNSDNLMPLSVFKNYLERTTRADDCVTSLIAVKIRRIDEIFANTSAKEFVDFLKLIADAISQEFKPTKVFMTHIGNGIFLCASRYQGERRIAEIERSVLVNLNPAKLPEVCRKQVPTTIVVGKTLVLKTTPKLNFNRASKAAVARMEKRDRSKIEAITSSLAG